MRAAGQHTLGLIYEDFLSNFAKAEGGLADEFFTPCSQNLIRHLHTDCSDNPTIFAIPRPVTASAASNTTCAR